MIKYQKDYYPEFVNILYNYKKFLQKTITERVNLKNQTKTSSPSKVLVKKSTQGTGQPSNLTCIAKLFDHTLLNINIKTMLQRLPVAFA